MSDSLAIPFVFLLFVIVIFTITLTLQQFKNIPIISHNEVANLTLNRALDMFTSFDYIIPEILFGLNVISLILMYSLRSNRILFFIFMIMMAITIVFAGHVANTYEQSVATMSVASSFPVTTFVMLKLPIIMFVFDVIGGILLLAVF